MNGFIDLGIKKREKKCTYLYFIFFINCKKKFDYDLFQIKKTDYARIFNIIEV